MSSSAKTATVRLPISFAARITRMAISLRFAIRIFLNSVMGRFLPGGDSKLLMRRLLRRNAVAAVH